MGPQKPPVGLRERRKLRTQHDLLRSGLELFAAEGYGRTTVGDIAQRADVSERTFFRYFANKEELVLEPIRESGALFLAEVARRPPAEEPLRAMREAGRQVLHTMAAHRPQEYLSALRLLCSEPDLQAACLRFVAAQQPRLAAVLAAREGVEPGDLRPALVAGAYCSAAMLATFSWGEQRDATPQALQAAADTHVGMVRAALVSPWR